MKIYDLQPIWKWIKSRSKPTAHQSISSFRFFLSQKLPPPFFFVPWIFPLFSQYFYMSNDFFLSFLLQNWFEIVINVEWVLEKKNEELFVFRSNQFWVLPIYSMHIFFWVFFLFLFLWKLFSISNKFPNHTWLITLNLLS